MDREHLIGSIALVLGGHRFLHEVTRTANYGEGMSIASLQEWLETEVQFRWLREKV